MLLIIPIITGCTGSSFDFIEKDETKIKLHPLQEDKAGKMSDLFSIEGYVPLETNERSVFGKITKLIVHDQHYFIWDEITNSILCFDGEGKFEFDINNEGEGPGEYQFINDFSIDENKIFIHDSQLKKILIFDLKGNFITESPIEILFNVFEALEDKYLFFTGFSLNEAYSNQNYHPNLIVTDQNFQNGKTYLFFDEVFNTGANIYPSRSLQKTPNGALVYQPYDDNLYQYSKNKFEVRYALSFEQDPDIGKEKDNPSSDNDGDIMYFLESEKLLHLIYKYQDTYHFVYHFKESEITKEFSSEPGENRPAVAIENDIDGISYYPLFTATNDLIYSYASSYDIVTNYDGVTDLSKYNITDDSNPVIVKLKVKSQILSSFD